MSRTRARRGLPKAGLRIHKGGRPRNQRPTHDLGTPELAAKRAALAPDPTLSTCPLDLALAKGLIDRDTHTAAGYFAACRSLVHGSPHPKALDLLRVSGADRIPETSHAERRYRAACDRLARRGSRLLGAVESFVIHERFPAWLLENTESAARNDTLAGLAVLLDWYKRRGQPACAA